MPLATSLSGMTRAVSVAEREVKIRIVERGSVEWKISFVSMGPANLPPFAKNIAKSTNTHTRSLTVNAIATAIPPVIEDTTPPARTVATTILTIYSGASYLIRNRHVFKEGAKEEEKTEVEENRIEVEETKNITSTTEEISVEEKAE
jgi:hypothetical protein